MPFGTSDGDTFDTPFDASFTSPGSYVDLGFGEVQSAVSAGIFDPRGENFSSHFEGVKLDQDELGNDIVRTAKGDKLTPQGLQEAVTKQSIEAGVDLSPIIPTGQGANKGTQITVTKPQDNQGWYEYITSTLEEQHKKDFGEKPTWTGALKDVLMGLNLIGSGLKTPRSNVQLQNARQMQNGLDSAGRPLPQIRQNITGQGQQQSIEETGVGAFRGMLDALESTTTTGAPTERGSISRAGLRTYDRELGRTAEGRFGQVPEEMSRGRGGPSWEQNRGRNEPVSLEQTPFEDFNVAWDRLRADLDQVASRHGETPQDTYNRFSRDLNDLYPNPEAGKDIRINPDKSNFASITVDKGPTSGRYTFETEDGNRGYISYSIMQRGGKPQFYVNGIYSQGGPSSLGYSATKELLKTIKAQHPEIKSISGFRVSGARGEADAPATATMKIPETMALQQQKSGAVYKNAEEARQILARQRAAQEIERSYKKPEVSEADKYSENDPHSLYALDLIRRLGQQ